MKFRNKLMVLPLLAMVGAGLTSCGPKDSEKINIYCAGPKPMYELLEKAFEDKEGKDVADFTVQTCGPLRTKVSLEVKNKNVQADIFFGANRIIYNELGRQGALEEYVSPNAKNIKKEFKQEKYHQVNPHFTLVSTRFQVIAYNKDKYKTDELPKTFMDLTDKKYEGEYVWTDPSTSSTGLALAFGIDKIGIKNGYKSMEFFDKIQDNDGLLTQKSKEVTQKIVNGERSIGISPNDAIYRSYKKAKKEGTLDKINLGMDWVKEAICIERPIAILKKENRSPEKLALCQRYIDFMLTKEAQEIMAGFGFYSTVDCGVYPSIEGLDLPEKPELDCTFVDWSMYGQQQENEMIEYFKKLMGDNYTDPSSQVTPNFNHGSDCNTCGGCS